MSDGFNKAFEATGDGNCLERITSISTVGRSNSDASIADLEKEQGDIEKSNLAALQNEHAGPPPGQHAWRASPTSSRPGTLSAAVQSLVKRDAESENRWSPSILQIRPMAGLCGLLVSMFCVFGSLAILVVSDGQPTDSWPVQPMVYLAIVAAISNSALRLARAQAIPISWYHKASRGGTVRSLEREWEVSHSFVRAVLHSRHMGLVNLACIAAAFVIIDGPLLQRASNVIPATSVSNVTLNLVIPPELPSGFSGAWSGHVLFYTADEVNTTAEWTNNTPMKINIKNSQCTEGTCATVVQAPGVVKGNCSSQNWFITEEMQFQLNATWGPWTTRRVERGRNQTSNPAFLVSLEVGQDGTGYPPNPPREKARLTVGRLFMAETGTFVQTACDLSPAILEYDVIIENGTIAISGDAAQARFITLANNSHPADIQDFSKLQYTTIDALTTFLNVFVTANASVTLSAGSMGISSGKPQSYNGDIGTYNPMVIKHIDNSVPEDEMAFTDPTPDVIAQFNQLMFRGSVLSTSADGSAIDLEDGGDIAKLMDPGVSIYQTVQAQQTIRQNVYKSDLRWYAGAAILEIVTTMLILPLFWGWWNLDGKDLSLSPFAVALAFDSPLLTDINSAAGPRGVVRQLGDMELKYGLVGREDAPGPQNSGVGRLGIGARADVVHPRAGMRFRG